MTHQELAKFLTAQASRLTGLPVVTGFDGFVDEMISVVDRRHSLTEFERIDTIAQFGEKISAAAGHSSLREIVVNQVDPGGCAINMGDGLASLGLPVTTFATVGQPMHPAFAEYASKAKLISWGDEPGRTLAYEFADGKLMFSAVNQLQKFNPAALEEYLKDGAFAAACAKAELIAITDWTLYPHMTACWEFLRERVFEKLPEKPRFFFDLVDPSTRSDEDVFGMLEALKRFGDWGHVTLGLNQNEANILSLLTGGATPKAEDPETALRQCAQLQAALNLDAVVIHSIRYAVATQDGEAAKVWGPYCEKPKKSTGAGDRFNAGYALGLVLGVPMEDCLTLACASSGYFVRHAHSANLLELAEFLDGLS
jgi:sugar/nucleoside kinase (ribokinase family)